MSEIFRSLQQHFDEFETEMMELVESTALSAVADKKIRIKGRFKLKLDELESEFFDLKKEVKEALQTIKLTGIQEKINVNMKAELAGQASKLTMLSKSKVSRDEARGIAYAKFNDLLPDLWRQVHSRIAQHVESALEDFSDVVDQKIKKNQVRITFAGDKEVDRSRVRISEENDDEESD